MSSNNFINKYRELAENHNEKFTKRSSANKTKHKIINSMVSEQVTEFEKKREFRKSDFNLIRNK